MNEEQRDEVVQLYLDDIIPNRFQPREVFDEQALKELAVSIREHGVIQPIIVRNINGKYEIIAGERRYKASALAGLTKIPAIIRNLDDKESSKVALLENLQRKNLNPIEEARTYQKILELDEMTQEELAKTMGKSQSAVANKLRLLSLPEDIQDSLLKEDISERHARALLQVSDSKIQKELLKKVISTKMSVRNLEDEIKTLYPKGKDASEIPIAKEVDASAERFLDSSPLTPTVSEIDEKPSNYGKVVIAPPKENNKEEEDTTSKFINYGEENLDPFGLGIENSNGMAPAGINQGVPGATVGSGSGSVLDNMLSIPNSQPAPQASNQPTDYFMINDLPSIDISADQLPEKVQKEMPRVQTASPLPTIVSNYTAEDATKKIQSVVEDLKNHGVKINADEMNFPKSYQVIIKIDKE